MHSEDIMASVSDEVRYFVAIELDAPGIEPFTPRLERLRGLGGEWYANTLEDGREAVTQANPLRWCNDAEGGVSDHPSCTADAIEMLGERVLIRNDRVASHWSPSINDVQDRFPGHDMSVVHG